MGTTVTTIKESVESKIETILSFKKLQHIDNVEKNSFKGGKDRYGVTTSTLTQDSESGTIGSLTYSVEVSIKLCTSIISTEMKNNAEVRIAELQDKMLTVYKDLTKTKAGLPAIVINVNNFNIGAIDIIEDDGIVVIDATFNILFRDKL